MITDCLRIRWEPNAVPQDILEDIWAWHKAPLKEKDTILPPDRKERMMLYIEYDRLMSQAADIYEKLNEH